jgi:hypothetical protein
MLISAIPQDSIFWLNVFMPLSRLNEYWLNEEQLILPLTPLLKMRDSREGWGKTSLIYKQVLPLIVNYNNRVKSDGGIVECHACTIKTLLGFYGLDSKVKFLRYDDLRDVLLTYLQLIKKSSIRSFFKTESVEEAEINRYMWDLYATVQPNESKKVSLKIPDKKVLLSFEWHSLAKAIEESPAEFCVEEVNYSDDINRLFYKNISYSHENEFRLANVSDTAQSPIFISIKDVKIVATICELDRTTEEYFEHLGFSYLSDTKKLRSSIIDVEASDHNVQDIERVIKLLDTIDPTRWDQVMSSNL